MAFSFAGAYVTSEMESLRLVHVTLGYTLAGLVGARLVWGIAGPRSARFASWISRLRPLKHWHSVRKFADLASLWPALGMLAIIGILLAAVASVASGIALYQEWGGQAWEDALEELHELAGNAMLFFVLLHLAMLTLNAVRRGRHQLLAMVTGRMPGSGPDLIQHNRTWVGIALLLVVLAFWGWQWQSAPPQTNEEPGTAWMSRDERDERDGHRTGKEEDDD